MFEWGRYSDGKGTPNLLRGEKQKFSSGIRTPSQYPRSLQPSKVASSLHPRPPFANRWGNCVTMQRIPQPRSCDERYASVLLDLGVGASLFRNERRPTHRHFEFDECPVCGSGHLGNERVLGTAIPSAPKDQALGQAAAETQTVNAIAARHQSAAVSLVPPLAELMAQTPFVPFSASESPLPFFRPLSAFSSLPPFCLPLPISESSQLSCLPPGASAFEPPCFEPPSSLPHCDLP
jgi:hypothetical protein